MRHFVGGECKYCKNNAEVLLQLSKDDNNNNNNNRLIIKVKVKVNLPLCFN
jgi:hypothetical protein